MKKVYYIETTLNGYIIKQVEICEWESGKDFIEDLIFMRDEDEIDYYNDIAGNFDDLDIFLRYADSTRCEDYYDDLGVRSNIYLEYWLTNLTGYYEDRFIGLMIK